MRWSTRILHETKEAFRNAQVNNQTTGRIIMNAIHANDRTILTIFQKTNNVRSYNKLELKEVLKCRDTMMLVVNELCCCNYCGKIRSTVHLYRRDVVRRFNTMQPKQRTPNGTVPESTYFHRCHDYFRFKWET